MVEIRKKSNGKKVLVRERAPKKSSAEYEYTPRDRYSRADSRDRRHKEEYRDYYDDHRDHRERQDYYPRFPPQPASTPQFPPPQPVPTFVATKPQVVYPQQSYKVRIQEPSYLRRSPSPPRRRSPDEYYYESHKHARSPRRDGFRSRSRSRSVYREEERGRKPHRPEEGRSDSWRNQYQTHPPTASEEDEYCGEFMKAVRNGETIPPAPEVADFMEKPRGHKGKGHRRR